MTLKGLTTPNRVVWEFLFVCAGVGTCEESPTGSIPWFTKTEGNTYATIAASPFPLQGKPTQYQDVATLHVEDLEECLCKREELFHMPHNSFDLMS